MDERTTKEPARFGRLQRTVQQLIDEDELPAEDAHLNARQRFLHFWLLVGRMFLKNRAPIRASALAYTTLLAMVPLLAISLSVAALFLPRGEEERRARLTEWIDLGVANVAPTLGLSDQGGSQQRASVATNIVNFVEKIHFGTITATAAASLIVVALGLLRTVESSFNDIWGVTRGRSLLLSVAFYWAVITLGPALVLLAKGANYASVLQQTQTGLEGTVAGQMLNFLTFFLPPLVMTLAFGALYFWMPNTRVRWEAALVGGAVASLLWTINGKLSAFYNTRVLTYNAIYGSLGALPLFLIGLYLTWLIVLFGAQVAYVFQNRRAYLQERLAGRVHQQAREFSAVRLMTLIATRFAEGGSPPTSARLAEDLMIPPFLVKEQLRVLVGAGLLNEVSGSESSYTPARPLDAIHVGHILLALRRGAGSDVPTAADLQRPVVQRILASVNRRAEADASSITLAALAQECRELPTETKGPQPESKGTPAAAVA